MAIHVDEHSTVEEWNKWREETRAAENRRWYDGEGRCLALAETGFIPCTASDSTLMDMLLVTILKCCRRHHMPATVIRMLRLRWEGYTLQEVAEKVQRPYETVRLLIRGASIQIQTDPMFGLYEVLAAAFRTRVGEVEQICRETARRAAI